MALVSHKIGELMAAADDLTIMRDGRVIESRPTAGADVRTLARAMVGREVTLRGDTLLTGTATDHQPVTHDADEMVLEVVGATVHGGDGRVLLDGFDVNVRAGEIVGVAGVEGNGQRALGDVLSSLIALDSGRVSVAGTAVPTGRAGAMSRAGVAVVPEDRHHSGCVLDFTVAENVFIADPERVARYGLMDHAEMDRRTSTLIDRFDISCTGPSAPMWSLSGGNQQRVVMARELSHEPTRAGGRPADPRTRCGRDRVPVEPGTSRRTQRRGGAADLHRAGRDPRPLTSDRRDLERTQRRRDGQRRCRHRAARDADGRRPHDHDGTPA